MSGSSSDVAGNAKKHQAVMTETKVQVIERVETRQKYGRAAILYSCAFQGSVL